MYSPIVQVRNAYYFILAFYVFVFAIAYLIYNRNNIYKAWFIFRDNDYMENIYVISISILFIIDGITITFIKKFPGRFEVYLHHFMISGIGIWCYIDNIGFLFLIFGGLQEASNLTFMGRVYLKKSAEMRFFAQLAHCTVFIFFRFILQITILLVATLYLKVSVCFKPVCIALNIGFITIFLLSIRWAYFDIKRLITLNGLRKNQNKGYSIQNNNEEDVEGKELNTEELPTKPKKSDYIFALILISAMIIILIAIPLILLNLSSDVQRP